MFVIFHHFINHFIRLFFLKSCTICQKVSVLSFCEKCLKHVASEAEIKSEPLGSGQVYYLYFYHPMIKALIAEIKYGHEPELLLHFLHLVSNHIKKIDHLLQYPLYVPVPLHIQKLLRRKFNQAELIAKSFSHARTCLLIKRTKETKALHGLSRKKRKIEVQNAFALNQSFKPYALCIVDDIFTTGSTLQEIAKLFPDLPLNYFCLAKTPLRL